MTVTTEVEQDVFLLASLLGYQCLVDCCLYGVRRLRSRDDSFCACKQNRCLEAGVLVVCPRLVHACVEQGANQRSHAVIPKTTSVNRIRNERVTKRVHFEQRSCPDCVAKVVSELALR